VLLSNRRLRVRRRHRLRDAAAAALALALAAAAIANLDAAATRESLYASNLGTDGRFRTPWANGERSLLSALRWTFSRSAYAGVEAPPTPVVANDGAYLSDADAPPSLTWVGHATYVVHDRGDVFLTDPHFTRRALLPPRLVAPGLPIETIPGDAFAVISHNHYDHLDRGTVQALAPSVGWYVPLGLAHWFRELGRRDVHELDWWQSIRRGRWKITCLPSQHWSQRIEQPANQTLWCAWLIESTERRYFFAGDTGYFHGFAEYGRLYPGIDAALLPIGAYSPRHLRPDRRAARPSARRAATGRRGSRRRHRARPGARRWRALRASASGE
jgi:N-acyl-phosphatidylethanolamine-hydrolysing phospholipase D